MWRFVTCVLLVFGGGGACATRGARQPARPTPASRTGGGLGAVPASRTADGRGSVPASRLSGELRSAGPGAPGGRAATLSGPLPCTGTVPPNVVEVHLPTEKERVYWVTPGDVTLLYRSAEPRPEALVALPLSGGTCVRLEALGPRMLRVNGVVRWVRLTGLGPGAAQALLAQHRQTVVAVGDDGRFLLRREGIRALHRLRGRRLVVVLESYRPGHGALARLARLGRRLGALVLAAARVTDADLRPLGRLRWLRALALADTPIGNAGLRILGRLRSLRHLHLSWARIDDAGLGRLGQMQGLRSLRVQAKRVSAAGIAALARLRHLVHLDLAETPVADEALAALGALPALASLGLRHTAVGDAGLRHLGRFRGLRHLSLQWTRVSPAGLTHLGVLGRLQWLNLSTTRLTDKGLAAIAALRQLVYLDLSGAVTTNQGLAPLAHLTRLRGLWLGPTNTGDDGLAHLAPLRALRMLDLHGGLLAGRGLVRLASLRHLRWIDLSETGVLPAALARFRRQHPGCSVRMVALVRRGPRRVGPLPE